MVIRKYGVLLRRLREEDLELVRNNRNSEDIRKHMFYQEIITPEMQKKWFHTVNNIHNHYFIVEYREKKVGMIFCKNDNYEEKSTEGGIFFWDIQYRNSFVPVIASVVFSDLGFKFRDMKKVYATIRKTNIQVINYITQLGYSLHEEFPNEEKAVYLLTKSDFFAKTEKIRKAIIKITRDSSELSENDIDLTMVSPWEREKLYSGYPDYIQLKLDNIFERR